MELNVFMMISNEIIKMIEKRKRVCIPVKETDNLYTDLGVDSLSFIALLLNIEEVFSITFDLPEMEMCIQIDRLLALVEKKIEERGSHD